MDFIIVDQQEFMLERDSSAYDPIHINISSHLNVRNAYSSNTYLKAALLMRMASHFLREDVFRNGLLQYLQEHEYSSATPDDLWKALQDALDESDVPHDDFNVKEVMDTWFKQAKYPLVTVNRDYATGEIKVNQEIIEHWTGINNEDGNNNTWWIPLNFATQSNLDFSSTLATHWLKPHDEIVTIEGVDINDWIIVNKHLTGFYRVNYDANNWKRIAAFLNSDNYDKIPVLNRVQILNDAYYMMMNERLDLVTFIEIINYLSRETDTVAWDGAFRILQKLNKYLQLPEGKTIIKPYLSNLIRKLLEKINLEENPDDDIPTTSVRTSLYRYDCTHGLIHVNCQIKMTAKLLAYVEDPVANQLSSNRKMVFCFGLMKANESVWDQFLQIEQTTSESFMFLGCTENSHIIEKHLNSLSGNTGYHYIFLFHKMITILSNIDTAIEFLNNNYEKIAEHIHISSILYNMIMNSFGEDQINKIKAFAEQHTIDIQKDLQDREKMLVKMKENLSKVRSILENTQSIDI